MAIFPGAAVPILTMGVVLEVAKLVTASWLYRYWKTASLPIKTYFSAAVIILSIITSMGIFGFLSKAHLEHSVSTGDNTLQVARLDRRIESEQRRITDAETVLSQLDGAVQALIDYDRIRGDDGAVATRARQADERTQLNTSIDEAIASIDLLSDDKLVLETEQLLIEVEVGPLLYVAEIIYGNTDKETLDKTVRFVIILLILVFDPLAILLVVAANMSMKERRGESITFMSEKDIDDIGTVTEDFGIEPTEESESEESIEITDDDMQHVQRLDRRVRKKLEWLIDKKGNKL